MEREHGRRFGQRDGSQRNNAELLELGARFAVVVVPGQVEAHQNECGARLHRKRL